MKDLLGIFYLHIHFYLLLYPIIFLKLQDSHLNILVIGFLSLRFYICYLLAFLHVSLLKFLSRNLIHIQLLFFFSHISSDSFLFCLLLFQIHFFLVYTVVYVFEHYFVFFFFIFKQPP